jgi:hypothetical protein
MLRRLRGLWTEPSKTIASSYPFHQTGDALRAVSFAAPLSLEFAAEWVMPVFSYFAIVGAVLVALFFLADATLEKGATPVVTSERVGLPKPWQPDPVQTLVTAPAPEPDMTSPAVLAAQPKAAAEVLTPPKKHVTRKQLPHYQQNQAWSRDRDRGPGGGFFFFGRF